MAKLDAIAAQPDQKQKIEQYKVALQQIISSGNVKECHNFASHSTRQVLADSVTIVLNSTMSIKTCCCSLVRRCTFGREQAVAHCLCSGALKAAASQPQRSHRRVNSRLQAIVLSSKGASADQVAACSLLEKIQPRVVSYEEQVTTVREQLAGLLEQEEEWSKAAQTLAGIDLDSGEHPVYCTSSSAVNPAC